MAESWEPSATVAVAPAGAPHTTQPCRPGQLPVVCGDFCNGAFRMFEFTCLSLCCGQFLNAAFCGVNVNGEVRRI